MRTSKKKERKKEGWVVCQVLLATASFFLASFFLNLNFHKVNVVCLYVLSCLSLVFSCQSSATDRLLSLSEMGSHSGTADMNNERGSCPGTPPPDGNVERDVDEVDSRMESPPLAVQEDVGPDPTVVRGKLSSEPAEFPIYTITSLTLIPIYVFLFIIFWLML